MVHAQAPRLPRAVGPAQIYAELRRQIVTLALKPGEKLSENELALRLGVSRTPVREALIRLADAGLVTVLPQRGTYIAPISIEAVKHARFVREGIELAVVREACGRLPPAFFSGAEELIAEQRKAAAAADYERFLAADEALHRSLAVAVGQERAWAIVEQEKAQMDRIRFLSLPGASPMKRLIAQHQGVVRALERNDLAAAEGTMRTHLREILLALPPIVRANPALIAAGEPD